MTAIKQFDKPTLKALRMAMDAALAQVGKDFGINIGLGSIRFSERSFAAKLNASVAGFDQRADDFKRYAELFGAKPEWLGVSYTTHQGTFTVKGINTKARTTPIILEDSNGKSYRASVDMVKARIK